MNMAQLGRYCKAYPIKRFETFPGWSIKTENLKKESGTARHLGEQDYFFLQENYVVTDGIFVDQNIVFDQITDAWKSFCTRELKFSPAASEIS
jgi:hypothetical protein